LIGAGAYPFSWENSSNYDQFILKIREFDTPSLDMPLDWIRNALSWIHGVADIVFHYY